MSEEQKNFWKHNSGVLPFFTGQNSRTNYQQDMAVY
jgi:hypothetical protein